MTKVVDATALTAWVQANQRDEYVPPPPPPQVMPLGVPGNWALVFSDEFDGTSLDQTKWNHNWLGNPNQITKPINSAELAAYDPAQVSVANGSLQLTAIRSTVVASNGQTYQYRSGLVESSKTFNFVYGAFETRVWMPGGTTAIPYNWGATWLNGDHNSWPDHGENDVMENLSGGPTVHYHFGSPDIDGKVNPPSIAPGGWSNSWHTYACVWNASGADYYYDGNLIGHLAIADPNPKYIVLNYGISTQRGGPLLVPNTMKVDYARVWKAN